MSGSTATVNGRPLCSVTNALDLPILEPVVAARTAAHRPKLTDNRWRTSKLERPRSAAGFWLSCGKFGSPALVKKPDASSVDLPSV